MAKMRGLLPRVSGSAGRVKDDENKMESRRNEMIRRRGETSARGGSQDVNLSDPKAGKPMGTMTKGDTSYTVMGGDNEDPRWNEYYKDQIKSKKVKGLGK